MTDIYEKDPSDLTEEEIQEISSAEPKWMVTK